MRRYAGLFVVTVAVGMLGRLLGGAHVAAPEAKTVRVTIPIAVTVLARDVSASKTSLPAGSNVALEVVNSSGTTARLRLEGYEDRVDTGMLAAGGTFAVTFVADRPGERFAWLVGDDPRGRLEITGSHLVEGHR